MKCWCKKMNIKWAQGIGIGAGEMMGGLRNVPMGNGPNTNLGLALDNLAKNINENKNISLTYETKSIIPMQKNKFTKVITNSIIKDFSNQF